LIRVSSNSAALLAISSAVERGIARQLAFHSNLFLPPGYCQETSARQVPNSYERQLPKSRKKNRSCFSHQTPRGQFAVEHSVTDDEFRHLNALGSDRVASQPMRNPGSHIRAHYASGPRKESNEELTEIDRAGADTK